MFYPKENFKLADLKGYTVIMPLMATMNASQLALDVLIASKKMQRIGHLFDLALMPVYGLSPFSHCPDEKASAAEVYAVPEEKLVVIQFRSGFVLKFIGPFLKSLAKFFKEAQIQRLIVLSNALGTDIEEKYTYSASESFKKSYEQELSKMKWKENGVGGLFTDKVLFKAFGPDSVPIMIFYHNIPLPVDEINEEFAVNELNDLIVEFLKIGDKLKPCLPNYWKYLLENETVELMY